MRHREAFQQMLQEMYNAKKLDILSKYYKFSKSAAVQGDYRYKACDDKDREELFQDFLDEIEANERDMRKEMTNSNI